MAASTPHEFWLALHALAEAYDAEGLTSQERVENIMAEFRKLPPTIRRSLVAESWRVAVGVSDIATIAHVTALELDATEESRPKGAAG